MKRILCFGDSNTYGTPPMLSREDFSRFARSERWTGVLQQNLGSGWAVIEEGLPGRTTVHDDPVEGAHRNGRTYLLPCLLSHRPIDAVILMLGTNDLKARFSLPPDDIADGIRILVEIINGAMAGPNGAAPKILVIAPPPLGKLDLLAGMFEGGAAKSHRLAGLYAGRAQQLGVAFLDAGAVIRSSDIDGIHFDVVTHRKLGEAITAVIREMNL